MARIKEIDVSKGIAIILVVVGHICSHSTPTGNDWYLNLRDIIYSFHMPLFIFLAGITSFHLFERINSKTAYFSFIKSKFIYFGKHFLFLSVIIFFGKLILQDFVHVDNGVKGLTDFFIILYDPLRSFSAFLWFIYTLLIFYSLTPILLKAFKKNPLPILFIAIIMHFIEMPTLFTLNRVFLFFIFYFSGYITGRYYTTAIKYIERYGLAFLALFLASLVIFYVYDLNFSQFLAIPAILYVSYLLKDCAPLNLLGKKSYFIYLYNTICIGMAKAVMFLIISWNGPAFILYFIVLALAGLVGPLCLQKCLQIAKEHLLRLCKKDA